MTKLDWKKDEKALYAPTDKPSFISIPSMTALIVKGGGAPSSPAFQSAVQSLFSLSYGLKFAPRKGLQIDGYQEYAVYPLEGLWDISDEAKAKGTWTKDDLKYTLSIRQPDFIQPEHIDAVKRTQAKKGLDLDQVSFIQSPAYEAAQILHVGSFDSEPASFKILEAFLDEQSYERIDQTHREIYLSDFTKTSPDKLKTILRVTIKKR